MRDHIKQISDSDLVSLKEPFTAPSYKLVLDNCFRLRELPASLSVPVLSLRGCSALATLPAKLDVIDLDLTDCASLVALPDSLGPSLGRVRLRGCAALRIIPSSIRSIAELDLGGCALIERLPPELEITRWLECAGSGLREISHRVARTTWRGVDVPFEIVLYPERIDAGRVLSEANAELRRVLLERMGYARFIEEIGAETIDRDRDPGGPRALLRAYVGESDALVLLSVSCPSTQRAYLLRVPPHIASCHAAAAWIAGFDDPSLYAPAHET
jgi:hypothetical protein